MNSTEKGQLSIHAQMFAELLRNLDMMCKKWNISRIIETHSAYRVKMHPSYHAYHKKVSHDSTKSHDYIEWFGMIKTTIWNVA